MEAVMALTPERVLLRSAADALSRAPHGKSAIAAAQAALLGCDEATLYRQIGEAGFQTAQAPLRFRTVLYFTR